MNSTAPRNSVRFACLVFLASALGVSTDARGQGLDTYLDEDPKTHWDNLVAPAIRRGDDNVPELVQEHWDLFHSTGYQLAGGNKAWEWFEGNYPIPAANWKKKQWEKAKKKFREGDPGALDWSLELWEFLDGTGYRPVLGGGNPIDVIKHQVGPEVYGGWREKQRGGGNNAGGSVVDYPLSPRVKNDVATHVAHLGEWMAGGGFVSPGDLNQLKEDIANDPNLSPGDKDELGGQIDDLVKGHRKQIVPPGSPLPDADKDGIPDALDRNPNTAGGFFDVITSHGLPDSTIFSIDVGVAKSRNASYYGDPNSVQPADQLPGVPTGAAFTARTFRFLALPRFPEGIDGNPPGPFSQLNDQAFSSVFDLAPNSDAAFGPSSPGKIPVTNPWDPRALTGFSSSTKSTYLNQAYVFRMQASVPQQLAFAGPTTIAHGKDSTDNPTTVSGADSRLFIVWSIMAQDNVHRPNPESADADGDGVSDEEEKRRGTDPNKRDTDGDGIIDLYDPTPLGPAGPLVNPVPTTVPHTLFPATDVVVPPPPGGQSFPKGTTQVFILNSPAADADGDGLSDEEEKKRGTDPNKRDTDGDGIIDLYDPQPLGPLVNLVPKSVPDTSGGLTVTSGSVSLPTNEIGDAEISGTLTAGDLVADMVLPDADGDGVSDEEEKKRGTDPNKKDTDGDGIIDLYDPTPLGPLMNIAGPAGGERQPPFPPGPYDPVPPPGEITGTGQRFNPPSLIGMVAHAPYFHDGRFNDLRGVAISDDGKTVYVTQLLAELNPAEGLEIKDDGRQGVIYTIRSGKGDSPLFSSETIFDFGTNRFKVEIPDSTGVANIHSIAVEDLTIDERETTDGGSIRYIKGDSPLFSSLKTVRDTVSGLRGRRGNIDIGDSVEYDFVPNNLPVPGSDFVHIQMHESDFNQQGQKAEADCPIESPVGSYGSQDAFSIGPKDSAGHFPIYTGKTGDVPQSYNLSQARTGRPRNIDRDSSGDLPESRWTLARIGLTPDLLPQTISPAAGTRQPVVVAVIDSGVDVGHPELWGQLWHNAYEIPFNGKDDDRNGYVDDVFGWNTQADTSDVRDDNGHGTHVAGIIAARHDGRGTSGLAAASRLMIVKAFDKQGRSDAVRVALGIRYAVLNGAKIIHISAENDRPLELEQAMIDWARSQGVLIVAAAGSRGKDTSKVSPAGLRGVLAVGACNKEDRRAEFSGWGRHVDLVAPGVDIVSLRARGTDFMFAMSGPALGIKRGERVTDDRWYRADGTSFAAPLVTGAAALLWAQNPERTPEQIERQLLMGCDDVENPGWDVLTGAGRLNIAKALAADPDHLLVAKVLKADVRQQNGKRVLAISGEARGTHFERRWLQVAHGKSPAAADWQTVESSRLPVDDGPLGNVPGESLNRKGTWHIRCVVRDTRGTIREAGTTFEIE